MADRSMYFNTLYSINPLGEESSSFVVDDDTCCVDKRSLIFLFPALLSISQQCGLISHTTYWFQGFVGLLV